MGLLKNILGNVAGKALSEVAKKIAGSIPGQTPVQAPSNPSASTSPVRPAYSSDAAPERTPEQWQAYFRGILQAECPGLTIRENVPVTDIAGPVSGVFQLYKSRPSQMYKAEWGKPYSFVLYDGAAPKAVVMLGAGHSHYSNVKYLIARMFAKKAGLPYINFYTQMPNERGYVVSRIHRFI